MGVFRKAYSVAGAVLMLQFLLQLYFTWGDVKPIPPMPAVVSMAGTRDPSRARRYRMPDRAW